MGRWRGTKLSVDGAGLLFQNESPKLAGQVELSSRNNWTSRNVCSGAAGQVEHGDMSECRLGVAGQVEMSSWSSWTSRNVVLELLARPRSVTNGERP